MQKAKRCTWRCFHEKENDSPVHGFSCAPAGILREERRAARNARPGRGGEPRIRILRGAGRQAGDAGKRRRPVRRLHPAQWQGMRGVGVFQEGMLLIFYFFAVILHTIYAPTRNIGMLNNWPMVRPPQRKPSWASGCRKSSARVRKRPYIATASQVMAPRGRFFLSSSHSTAKITKLYKDSYSWEGWRQPTGLSARWAFWE